VARTVEETKLKQDELWVSVDGEVAGQKSVYGLMPSAQPHDATASEKEKNMKIQMVK